MKLKRVLFRRLINEESKPFALRVAKACNTTHLDNDRVNRPTPNGYQRAYHVDQLIKLFNHKILSATKFN